MNDDCTSVVDSDLLWLPDATVTVAVSWRMAHLVLNPDTHDWTVRFDLTGPVHQVTMQGPDVVDAQSLTSDMINQRWANRCLVADTDEPDATSITAPHSSPGIVGGTWPIQRWPHTPTLEMVSAVLAADLWELFGATLGEVRVTQTEYSSALSPPISSLLAVAVIDEIRKHRSD